MPTRTILMAVVRGRLRLRLPRVVRRPVAWLSRGPVLSVVVAALAGFTFCAGIAVTRGILPPYVADEQSYLLAADTFAHGRLTNPPSPCWPSFETIHVLQQPTYASMYPPAQGMVLALGQVLTGKPVVGVWLGVAFMAGALCWMLRAFVPPRWALGGTLVALMQWGLLTTWTRSYWGGAVAAAGGALLFGALARVLRRWRPRDAVILGIALIILANSRPFEGLVVSIPALGLLAWRLLRLAPPARPGALRGVALPLALVVAAGGSWLGYYNWRVTGHPFLLPWQLHHQQYSSLPIFIWQKPNPAPPYHSAEMRAAYQGDELNFYRHYQVPGGFRKMAVAKLGSLFTFYLGPSLALLLLALSWALRDRWTRWAILVLLLLLGANLLTVASFPHYVAPAAALLALVLVRCARWVWRWQPLGPLAVVAAVIAAAPLAAGRYILEDILPPTVWPMQRQHFVDDLLRRGGKHLVMVIDAHHGHEEVWVANAADIDHAPIVWAHTLTGEENARLLAHFPDRTVWMFETDVRPRRLIRYVPPGSNQPHEDIPGTPISPGP